MRSERVPGQAILSKAGIARREGGRVVQAARRRRQGFWIVGRLPEQRRAALAAKRPGCAIGCRVLRGLAL